MSSIFNLDLDETQVVPELDSGWGRLGLAKNPFPESGVHGRVSYVAHMPEVVAKTTHWLQETARKRVGEPRGPFALEGNIGAGKTHLLAAMEQTLKGLAGVTVVRESLVNAGGGRLLLSTLFGTNLKLGEIASDVLLAPDLDVAIVNLPSASPIREAFAKRPDAETVALWLRGSTLSRNQLQRVGGRNLDSEGERLRAVIHLLRLAASVGDAKIRIVVLLLDQLEDLERKSEITPLRRARFLTDLRIFIDEGLEGAPIALCTAWNTEGTKFMASVRSQYPALASRLDNRVVVPALPQAHLIPFAQAYLDEAYASASQTEVSPMGQRKLSIDAKVAGNLSSSIMPLPGGDVAPREWLAELRKWAEREAVRAAART